MFSTSLNWERGPLELNVGANYTGKRYYSYSNDAGVPAFWLANAGGSWDFGKVGAMQELKLALHVTNLTDKLYADTLYRGFYGAGAPRSVQLTLKSRF